MAQILDKQVLQHYANKMCNADNRKVGSKSLPTVLNDIDTAIEKWSRSRTKINWDNLFIEMYTDSPQVESEFMNASVYSKRVCFVPYASSYKDSFQLKMGHDQKEFWEAVNGNASNGKSSFAYDLIGLLLGDEECKNRSILK